MLYEVITVIIGIASVVAIVTTGEYFQEQVTETLEELGGDTITIVASTPFEISSEEAVVITSYSIHYTKLYEFYDKLLCMHKHNDYSVF